jgi:D-psicose/D-tagatose/L-ribulose 3-epimerase
LSQSHETRESADEDWILHVSLGPAVTPSQRPIFEQLKKTGYDGVEIPVISGDIALYREIGDILDGIGLERTTLTVLPGGKNPLSEHRVERRAAVDHLEWALDCSVTLNSKLICGPIHQTLGEFSGAAPSETEMARLCEFHRAVGDLAAQRNIVIAVEAMNRFEAHCLNTMRQLVDYMDRVGHPSVTGMFDTFHANIEERDPVEAITLSLRHLAHVHISKNDRGTPGRGHVPWGRLFTALKQGGYDGWLTIEAFGRASPEFAARTRVWRDLSSDSFEAVVEGYRHVRAGWDAA